MNPARGILYQGKNVAIGTSKFKGKEWVFIKKKDFEIMWYKKEK